MGRSPFTGTVRWWRTRSSRAYRFDFSRAADGQQQQTRPVDCNRRLNIVKTRPGCSGIIEIVVHPRHNQADVEKEGGNT
jgi:hypothetical protein